MIEKSIRILTYLLLFIYPSGLLLRFKLFSNVHLVPQDILVFCLFVLISASLWKKKNKPFKKFYLYQLLFIVIGVGSLVFNSLFYKDVNFFVSLLYALRYMCYLSLIFVPSYFDQKKALRKMLLFSGGGILLIGFIQYVFYNSLRPLFYLGWDDHLYRLFSSFLDPNFTGLFLVLYLVFLAVEFVIEPLKASYKELIISFFTAIGIFVTYSRTALVSLIISLSVYGLFKKKWRQLILIGIGCFVVLLMISDVTIEGLNPFRTASTNQRLLSVQNAIDLIKSDPMIGVGLNAYRYAQVRHGLRTEAGALLSNADAGTDNSVLFVLATSGIIGTIPFLLSYIFLIREISDKNQNRKFLFISYVLALFTGSLFINALFYTPILTWFFLTLDYFKNSKEYR